MRLRLFFSLSDSPPLLILPGCCHGIVILDIQKRIPGSFLRFASRSRSLFSAEENPAIGNVFIFYVSRDGKIPGKNVSFRSSFSALPSSVVPPAERLLPSPPPPFPSVPFLLKKYLFFVFGGEVGRGLQLGVNEKSNGTRPLWTGNLDHARHAFRCVNKATLNKT